MDLKNAECVKQGLGIPKKEKVASRAFKVRLTGNIFTLYSPPIEQALALPKVVLVLVLVVVRVRVRISCNFSPSTRISPTEPGRGSTREWTTLSFQAALCGPNRERKDSMHHTVLNPDATEISVPKWVLIRLRAFKLLEWNREARRHQISPRYFAMREVIEGYSRPRRSAPARDYSQIRIKTKHRGRVSTLYKILGPDCSGPPNEMECTCRECLDQIPVIRGEGLKRR